MTVDLLLALEQSDIAQALRVSRWGYAAANVGHVLGIALLFGAIVPLDLRRLGLAGRGLDERALARLLVPVAASGLLLALATGLLLVSVRISTYALSPLFLAKMALITLALATIAAAALSHAPAASRLAAALSLLLWASVIVCGRLLGYWED